MTQTLKVAVIGAGYFGRHHVRHYAHLPHVEFAGILDADKNQAEALCAEHGGRVFGSIDELKKADVQAVTLATPAETHKELGLELLKAGIATLIEKPLATTVDDCDALVAAAEQTGTPLSVGHIERFNPVIQTLKAELNDTPIHLLSIRRQFPFPARMTQTGIALDLVVHDADLATYLCQAPLTHLQYHQAGHHTPAGDLAMLQAVCGSALVQLSTHWHSPFALAQLELATADNYYIGNLRDRTLTRQALKSDTATEIELSGEMDALKAELTAFTLAVLNKSVMPVPASAGRDAVVAVLAGQ